MNSMVLQRDPDADAFAHTLALVESGFRLARPDARQWAEKERNKYLLTAIGLMKRGEHMADQAQYFQDRAAALSALLERHKDRALYRDDRGILPAQIARPARRDPIVMLVEKQELGHDHQVAAQQIAMCYEAIVKVLMPKIRDIRLFVPPPKNSGRKVFDGMPPRIEEMYTAVYLPWTREMHAHRTATPCQNLPLVLDIVVDGLSIDAARRQQRPTPTWHEVVATLARGLVLWGEMAR